MTRLCASSKVQLLARLHVLSPPPPFPFYFLFVNICLSSRVIAFSIIFARVASLGSFSSVAVANRNRIDSKATECCEVLNRQSSSRADLRAKNKSVEKDTTLAGRRRAILLRLRPFFYIESFLRCPGNAISRATGRDDELSRSR